MTARSLTALLLAASLAVNAAQLARRDGRSSSASAPTPIGNKTQADAPMATAPTASINQASAGGSATAAAEPAWSQFATRDPAVLARRLRTAGFSPQASRAAVMSLMMQLHEAEMAQAMKALPLDPYWKVGGHTQDFTRRREFAQMWAERSRGARELFPEFQAEIQAWRRARYGNLPDHKLEQLALLERDYASLRSEVMMQRNDPTMPRMPWTSDELRVIDQELQRERAGILTPAELEEYNFRNSRTARAMGRAMASFNPTEAEFREIYRLRADFDERYTAPAIPTPQWGRERREAQLAVESALKSYLGDARYAEYQRANDSGFQAAQQVSQRLGLTAATAASAHQIQREVEQRVSAVRSDRNQTPAQRTAAIAAVRDEAQARLQQVLTEKGWNEYRNQAGWWRMLEQQAAPPQGGTPRP